MSYKLLDELTGLFAQQLHYFDEVGKQSPERLTAEDVTRMCEGGILRYRTDPVFNAKVKSLVASTMRIVQLENASLREENQQLREFRDGKAGPLIL